MSNARKITFSVAKLITWVLVVLLIIGVIGFFSFFTNGFTGSLKTFYLKLRDDTIMSDKASFQIAKDIEYRFEVKYTFAFLSSEAPPDYHVKITPIITDETNFDFTVDGKPYSFEGEADLTKGFQIKKHEGYFTLKATNDLKGMIEAMYPSKKVENVPKTLGSGIDYYLLTVSSEDYGVSIKIALNLVTLRFQITPGGVVF